MALGTGAATPTSDTFTNTSTMGSMDFPTLYQSERERRIAAETALGEINNKLAGVQMELEETKRKLAAVEAELEALRNTSVAAHLARAYQEMNPGEALVATVAAPVIAAPLAIGTVMKGFEAVGTGIASVFRKGKETKTPADAEGERGHTAAQD
ncbi:hypothetical protein BDZ91DRAFT_767617 [Kalaharituber pfeilii]|nr:hypothetical protein BDZ91DRAFT_767617 [Kalaharituber pfeilii]